MTSRNRETLKNFFQEGQRPTEDHFADLIDSMLNMSDDGFRKTIDHGQELSTPLGHDALLSFFRDQHPQTPRWSVGFSPANDQLLIHQDPAAQGVERSAADAAAGPPQPLFCLDPLQRVGIATESPETELDVAGTVRSRGRLGSYPQPAAPPLADGQWHDLTGDLVGCQAFEVMAGVAHRGIGRVAMMHAVALNAFNPTFGLLDFLNRKRGIRATHAYYSRWIDRLHLRWNGTSGKNACYRLQVKSGSNYGKGIVVQAHLTQLWFDPHMNGASL